jgi:hypothetical protein
MKMRVLITIWFYFSISSLAVCQEKSKQRFVIKAIDLWAYYDNPAEKKEYYGLFLKRYVLDKDGRNQEFESRKINLKEYLPQTQQPNYSKIKADSLIFVFCGFDSLKTKIIGWIPDLTLNNLFPGQSFTFNIGQTIYHIYSKGEIIHSSDSNSVEVFNGIKDYRIGIRTKQNDNITDQTIAKFDFMERWSVGDYLGEITIEWLGDLNGDGDLDIIIMNRGHHECYQLKLISADNQNKFRKVYHSTICGG